jgi:hypothetical protein
LQEADPVHRHPVDIVSGALGALVVTLGVLIITRSLRDFDHRGGWWFAIAGIVVAIAIVPWRGDRAPAMAEQPHADPPVPRDPEPVTDSTTLEI